MIWVYNLLVTLLAPLWVPMLLWKHARRKEAVNWQERQGNYAIQPRADGKRIWVHAVSVGEVLAAKPILRRLREALPEYEILVSVTTATGHAVAVEQLTDVADTVTFFPLDVPRFQLAALARVQPSVVAIMETELWLNFLTMAKNFGAETLLINGRISDRSFRRSGWVLWLMQAVTRQLDRCLMQTELDAERMRSYGGANVEVYGNSKFDQALEPPKRSREEWLAELGLDPAKPIVVVGSTRGEEEEAFVAEGLRLAGIDGMQVVHAPRHIERAEAIAERVQRWRPDVGRRSRGDSGGYLILDTFGELAEVYQVADVAVVGGGFADHGGQNLLQPLAAGKPVVHGPHMQNFADVAAAAAKAGATRVAASPDQLAAEVRDLLEQPTAREHAGRAAHAFVKANIGASDRYAAAIVEAARRQEAVAANRPKRR